MKYVDELLEDETMLRKVFESDLIVAIDSSHSLIQTTIKSTPKDSITFEEFASPWWHWDTCPYVLARRAAGTESHPGIKQSYVTSSEMWTRRYLIPYFGKYKLQDISVDMINTFWQVLKDKHGLAPKTINNIRSVFIIMMKLTRRNRNFSPMRSVQGSLISRGSRISGMTGSSTTSTVL